MSAAASSSSSVTDDVAGRCDGEPKFAVSSLHVERCFDVWVCGTCLENPIFLRLGICVCPFKWVQLRGEVPSSVGLPRLPRDFDSSKRPAISVRHSFFYSQNAQRYSRHSQLTVRWVQEQRNLKSHSIYRFSFVRLF